MAIDFQGLLNVASATERNPNVDMMSWDCGTTQCMIGSFCSEHKDDDLKLVESVRLFSIAFVPRLGSQFDFDAVAARFGITHDEATWIFGHEPDCLWRSRERRSNPPPVAAHLEKEDALARLRKFIYYKLKKQEMVVEEGRNKRLIDAGRHVSGNRAAMLAQGASL